MAYEDPYYRIYYKDSKISIINLQYFDEIDYDGKGFLTANKFITEELAERYLFNIENNPKKYDQLPVTLKEAIRTFNSTSRFGAGMFMNILDN